MNMTIVKNILLTLIGMLIISGCATTQVADETPVPQQPAEVASSTPQENLDEEPAEEMQPPVQVTFDQVYFAYDQSTLSEQARAALSNNAVILQTSPDLKVSIEGHCDDRGSDEYNLALGERRARASPGRIPGRRMGSRAPCGSGWTRRRRRPATERCASRRRCGRSPRRHPV